MSKTELPCKDCDERYVGCHSRCPEYLSWRADRDENLKKIREVKELELRLNDTEIKRNDKIRKSKKNKRSFGR